MMRPHLTSLTNRLPWKTSLLFVIFAVYTASLGGGTYLHGVLWRMGIAGKALGHGSKDVYLCPVPGGQSDEFEECSADRAVVLANWATWATFPGPVFILYTVQHQSLSISATPLWDFSTSPNAEIARPAAVRALEARFPGKVLPALAHSENATDRRLRWSGVVLNALFALALLVLILKLAAHLLPCHDRSKIGRAA